jgi:hypothetical protein
LTALPIEASSGLASLPQSLSLDDAKEVVGAAGATPDATRLGMADVPALASPSADTSSSAATDAHSRFGELIEALEERVIEELERRGGRYSGVF